MMQRSVNAEKRDCRNEWRQGRKKEKEKEEVNKFKRAYINASNELYKVTETTKRSQTEKTVGQKM